MDGSFVEAIVDATNEPTAISIAGEHRVFAPEGWQEIKRDIPAPGALVVNTLTGLVDYVKANVDALTLPECLVHVKDPNEVLLRAKLEDESTKFRRRGYVRATTELVAITPFPFGQYHDAEQFFIALQSLFVNTPPRAELLLLIASIRESTVRETTDDGVAQQVKVQQGVVFVNERPIPNPVTLMPYRTFREVNQPESAFIIRARSNDKGDKPLLALFEADGGRWKLEAIQNVAAFLREQLPAMQVIA